MGAKVPLLIADPNNCLDPLSMAEFRRVTLRATPANGSARARFDCVAAIDSFSSESPTSFFRAQVLTFFRLPRALVLDSEGQPMLASDVHFSLVGTFRTVVHRPHQEAFTLHDGEIFRRQDLLGGPCLVHFPPNHETMGLGENWKTQRFKVLQLHDIKSTIHIIPLTTALGTPSQAAYDHDNKMHSSIPNSVRQQLFLSNKKVHI